MTQLRRAVRVNGRPTLVATAKPSGRHRSIASILLYRNARLLALEVFHTPKARAVPGVTTMTTLGADPNRASTAIAVRCFSLTSGAKSLGCCGSQPDAVHAIHPHVEQVGVRGIVPIVEEEGATAHAGSDQELAQADMGRRNDGKFHSTLGLVIASPSGWASRD